jgi:hypothetical protein
MGILSNLKDALTGGDPKLQLTSTLDQQQTARSGSAADQFSAGSSFGRSATGQTVAFEDMFRQLYGGAGAAATAATAGVGGIQQQAGQLFGAGTQFLESLQAESEQARRLADTGVEDEQIGLLGQDLSRFFAEELNPAITSQAVRGGALGGGRQGVAQGRAADTVLQEFARGATGIRASGVARRDALAQGADVYRLGAGQVGLGGLGAVSGVGSAGFGAELAPYQMLSQILGGPTTLTTSGTEQGSTDIASAMSRAFGESQGTTTQRGYTPFDDEGLLDMYQQFNESGGIFGWLGI